MFGNSGADYFVEAGGSSIEQSGSDNLETPFKRLPRRPRLPSRPFYTHVKRGSGGTWLLKDQGASRRSFSKATSPPAAFCLLCRRGQSRSPSADGEISVCLSGGFAAAAASFFLSDQKETKESPGAAHGHLRCPTPPPPDPLLRECRRGAPALAAGAVPS